MIPSYDFKGQESFKGNEEVEWKVGRRVIPIHSSVTQQFSSNSFKFGFGFSHMGIAALSIV